MTAPIQPEGLDQIQHALTRAPEEIRRALEMAIGKAAGITLDEAQGLVPRGPSGDARASLRLSGSGSTQTVIGGGRRAPYYGWLEFGGKTGIKNSVERRFVKGGRYIWPAFDSNRKRILDLIESGVADGIRSTGLEVT